MESFLVCCENLQHNETGRNSQLNSTGGEINLTHSYDDDPGKITIKILLIRTYMVEELTLLVIGAAVSLFVEPSPIKSSSSDPRAVLILTAARVETKAVIQALYTNITAFLFVMSTLLAIMSIVPFLQLFRLSSVHHHHRLLFWCTRSST
jgi:hypothetical protein